MRKPTPVAAGWWWRFSRYEVRSGCIRPAAGATLETYDPWEDYFATHSLRRGSEPLYQRLLSLLKKIRFEPGVPWQLDRASETALLGWCGRYGLMGILPHKAQMVVLAPRLKSQPSGRPTDTALCPVLRRYVRTSTGWQE